MDENKKNKIESILVSKPRIIHNNCLCFGNYDHLPHMTSGNGIFAKIQDYFKKHSVIYYFLVELVSPVKLARKYGTLRKGLFNRYQENSIIINYGSGPQHLFNRHDIINVDLFAFNEVDIATDTILPFNFSDEIPLIMDAKILFSPIGNEADTGKYAVIKNKLNGLNKLYFIDKPQGKISDTIFLQKLGISPRNVKKIGSNSYLSLFIYKRNW